MWLSIFIGWTKHHIYVAIKNNWTCTREITDFEFVPNSNVQQMRFIQITFKSFQTAAHSKWDSFRSLAKDISKQTVTVPPKNNVLCCKPISQNKWNNLEMWQVINKLLATENNVQPCQKLVALFWGFFFHAKVNSPNHLFIFNPPPFKIKINK